MKLFDNKFWDNLKEDKPPVSKKFQLLSVSLIIGFLVLSAGYFQINGIFRDKVNWIFIGIFGSISFAGILVSLFSKE